MRSGINTSCLALALFEMIQQNVQGVYHLGGPRPVSLYEMGEKVVQQFDCDPNYLIRASRHEDPEQLPRIGNVHLDSAKAYRQLSFCPQTWPEGYEK